MTTTVTYTVTYSMEAGGQQYKIFDDCVTTKSEAIKVYNELVEQGRTGIEITVKTETYSCVTETIDVNALIEQVA